MTISSYADFIQLINSEQIPQQYYYESLIRFRQDIISDVAKTNQTATAEKLNMRPNTLSILLKLLSLPTITISDANASLSIPEINYEILIEEPTAQHTMKLASLVYPDLNANDVIRLGNLNTVYLPVLTNNNIIFTKQIDKRPVRLPLPNIVIDAKYLRRNTAMKHYSKAVYEIPLQLSNEELQKLRNILKPFAE